MALINCPECKNEVSTEAKSCPKCGKKLKAGYFIKTILVIVGGFWAIGVVLSIGNISHQDNSTTDEPSNAVRSSSPASKIYTREEFKQIVIGHVPAQLPDLVGVPDLTQTSGSSQYWYYRNRTVDTLTGKIDQNAQVVIGDDNLVSGVNF